MIDSRYKLLRLLVPLIIFLLGCPAPVPQPAPQPQQVSSTGITLLGQTRWIAPGSRNTFLVQVRTPYGGPVEKDRKVEITLNDRNGSQQKIFEGKTDASGIARVKFDAPDAQQVSNPNLQMQVVAETQYGVQTYQQDVYLGKVFNMLISSDKPIYQPGQTIHMRALALDSNNLKAAQGMTITLTVADPQGNKLMRKELATSDYGIAAADFVLDSQASSGDYIITTEMGPITSSRSVEVKPYVLPRFKIDFSSAQSYYRPGDIVTGTVNANYFFGKPVANGKVTIKGFVTDFERNEVFSVESTTDESGVATYQFNVPDYFAGQLENKTAKLDLEISVIDSANHQEKVDEDITVAEQPLLVDVVAESGTLRGSLENVVYIHTHYPDGGDAQTEVAIHFSKQQTQTVTTDIYGLATFTVTPKSMDDLVLNLEASDANGISTTYKSRFDIQNGSDNLILRSDKAEYQIGDTLNIDIAVRGQSRTVYLDVIKGRQTFALVPLPIKNGKASAAINIDGTLLGTLELNAYVVATSGEIIHDQRYVLVNPAPAQIDVAANAAQYRPGDTATLDINLRNNGQPMQGAVGISIVDESVFALGAQEPGFARTYFLLNRQLLEPRYEIHDFPGFGKDASSPYDNQPSSIQTALSDQQKLVMEQSRQIALAGFFAQASNAECGMRNAECAAATTQTATDNSQLLLGWANRALLALPLIGLAFYDGTRKRRYLAIGMLLLSMTGGIISACAPAGGAAAPAAGAAEAAAADSAAAPAAQEAAATVSAAPEPPRLRQFFPETLFWLPEQETDANGHLTIDVPIADSITTWRVSVIASDKNGNLGSAQAPLKVFQDFFVEPDFPRFLTVGDEISVPVSVYNYLAEKQTVKLEIEKADWFEFVQDSQLSFEIGANEVAAAYVPIRVTGFGKHEFKISASGSHMSDAVLKSVEVLPDGKQMTESHSGKLRAEQSFTVAAPKAALPGTSRLIVKFYPGVVSQMVDGLEGMLAEPYGCFEQTSSTTYPNVLILDYLNATKQSNPRLQMTAERYINLGYQRLLSFEVDNYPGGFSLFGDPPAQLMLTAYGLMEFGDMAKVSYVDPDVIGRAATFIMNQQQGDGSWQPAGMTIESGLENMGNNNLLPTAYILWALADAGYAQSYQAQQAVAYINAQLALNQPASPLTANSSPEPVLDPYALALLANALIAVNPQDQLAASLLDQLVERANEDSNGYYSWNSGATTYMGGYGDSSNTETSAMMILAALRSGRHLDAAQKATDALIAQRNGNGTYYSTQTTVLVLKALLAVAKEGGEGKHASVTVTLNNGQKQTIQIDDNNSDVVQLVAFDNLDGSDNQLQINVVGERAVQYQLITDYYLPWSAQQVTTAKQAVKIDVQYDRTEMKVNDQVGVTATVELQTEKQAGTLMVTLGVPPGFLPVLEDFDVMVAQDQIDRYDFTLREINVYMTNVAPGQPITLNYHLLARYPVKAQTPASGAYDYYAPEQNGDNAPQRIVVNLGTADE